MYSGGSGTRQQAQKQQEQQQQEAKPQMMYVAKKKPEISTKKPEVMEQNQDGLEYSSEEEVDVNDLNDKLKEKGKKDLVKTDHNAIEYQDFKYVEMI